MTREKAVDLVMNAQQGVCRRAGVLAAAGQVLEFRGQRQLVPTAEAGGKLPVGCPAVA